MSRDFGAGDLERRAGSRSNDAGRGTVPGPAREGVGEAPPPQGGRQLTRPQEQNTNGRITDSQ